MENAGGSPMPRISAGLLMYRRHDGKLQMLLAHPGGPFFKNKDDGAWTIPKGEIEPGEDLLEAAQREFKEETDVTPTGSFIALTPVDTDRKKRANFDREDGATRHVSGAHYGAGAHTGRSQREVIVVRGAILRSRMWREVGCSAAAGGQRVPGSHISSIGPPPDGSFKLRCCRNRITSEHSRGSAVSRWRYWIRAWNSGEPATSHSAA